MSSDLPHWIRPRSVFPNCDIAAGQAVHMAVIGSLLFMLESNMYYIKSVDMMAYLLFISLSSRSLVLP